jgi:hypothetical protein
MGFFFELAHAVVWARNIEALRAGTNKGTAAQIRISHDCLMLEVISVQGVESTICGAQASHVESFPSVISISIMHSSCFIFKNPLGFSVPIHSIFRALSPAFVTSIIVIRRKVSENLLRLIKPQSIRTPGHSSLLSIQLVQRIRLSHAIFIR